MNIRENEEIENLREIEKLKIQHILNYNFWHNWEDNDEMKWIDNAYYDENELSRLKQTKLVKHGLRDLTAIVHGKYQYTRYTHTPLLQQQLKILTDRRPFELEQHLKPEVPTTDVPPNGAPPSTRNIWNMLPRLMKSMMSPLNWQLQYVHDTAPTLTYNHLTFARNWTTLQHQELMIPTYQTTLTFEYWNWTGNLHYWRMIWTFYKLN